MARVLVACEWSGTLTRELRDRGVEAYSCDLEPASHDWHIQGDVLSILHDGWDAVIAFPPCTDIAISGARWFPEKIADGRQQYAIEFFMKFVDCAPRWCIENPVGVMSTVYRQPDQIVCPTMFGHKEAKRTCLWLNGLPLLEATLPTEEAEYVSLPSGKRQPKWYANASKKDRGKKRGMTFPGLAKAMAASWTPVLLGG